MFPYEILLPSENPICINNNSNNNNSVYLLSAHSIRYDGSWLTIISINLEP